MNKNVLYATMLILLVSFVYGGWTEVYYDNYESDLSPGGWVTQGYYLDCAANNDLVWVSSVYYGGSGTSSERGNIHGLPFNINATNSWRIETKSVDYSNTIGVLLLANDTCSTQYSAIGLDALGNDGGSEYVRVVTTQKGGAEQGYTSSATGIGLDNSIIRLQYNATTSNLSIYDDGVFRVHHILNISNNASYNMGFSKVMVRVYDFTGRANTMDWVNITYLTEDAPVSDTPTCSFNEPPTPADSYKNSTLGHNYSATCTANGEPIIYFGSSNPPTQVVANASGTGLNTTSWIVNASIVSSEGVYYAYANCTNASSVATSVRSYTYDTSSPSITLNANNHFNTSNQTQDIYRDYLPFDITISDNIDLYAFSVNITYSNGTSYYSYVNQSLSGSTTFNFNRNISISDYPQGLFNVEIGASDSHTDILWDSSEETIINKNKKEINFLTPNKNLLAIKTDSDATISTNKLLDRYMIEFEFDDNTKKDRTFDIESNADIIYLEDSPIPAHFIIKDGIIDGNWLDFVTYDDHNGYDVTKSKDKDGKDKYSITFYNLDSKVKFHSIGGLNVNYVNYKFNRSSFALNSVLLQPQDTAVTTNTLQGFCRASDQLGFNVDYDWRMYKDSTINASGSLSSQTSNESINFVNISSLAVGEEWVFSCRTTTSESLNYTIWQNSSTTTIVGFILDNCTQGNATTLNISFWDLSNTSLLNVNMEAFFQYDVDTSYNYNYSLSNPSVNNFEMCIYPANVNLYSDFLINYNNLSYNTYQINLTNISQNLRLYLPTNPTLTTFTVYDYSNNIVEDAFISILQWDVGTNTYKTTEILKTDSTGQAVGNIVLYTEYYRFIVSYEGQVKLIDPDTQGVKMYSNTRTFKISLDDTEYYNDWDTTVNAFTNLTFNNATKSFTFTWVDSSGAMENGCLLVVQRNNSGTTTLSDSCTESASATIVYSIGATTGNRYTATSYFKFGDIVYVDDVLEQYYEGGWEIYQKDSNWANYMVFILLLAMIFIGLPLPELSFILLSVGMIVSALLGLWNVSIPIIVAIIILGLLHAFMGNRK